MTAAAARILNRSSDKARAELHRELTRQPKRTDPDYVHPDHKGTTEHPCLHLVRAHCGRVACGGTVTSIEWTDVTWNCIRGCSRVSTGCENCYAEQVARRFAGPGQPYEGLVRLTKEGKPKAQWNGTVRFIPEHLADPLSWRKPRRVFVNSMSDLFHEGLAFEDIAAIFGVMAACPQHTFQVLTKRPARAREFFDWLTKQDASLLEPTTVGRTHAVWCALRSEAEHHPDGDSGPMHTKRCADPDGPWPLPNVWLGVSVENQATADERIPWLLELPAAVRWVSYEPALGPVDFTSLDLIRQGPIDSMHPHDPIIRLDALRGHVRGPDDVLDAKLDWIVIGGESGPGARPFDLAWARSTIEQCRAARVACFLKQVGASPVLRDRCDVSQERFVELDANGWDEHHGPPTLRNRKGGEPREWPEDLRVREYPQ